MKLGMLKGKLEGMDEAPMPMEGGEEGLPLEEMPAEEDEMEAEPVDLAAISDEDLLAEAKKRKLI